MARRGAPSFGCPMETQHAMRGKHHAVRNEKQPSPEPFEWKKAVPPRIVGKNHSRAGESRPGETAKRGFEKAVEDWWWL